MSGQFDAYSEAVLKRTAESKQVLSVYLSSSDQGTFILGIVLGVSATHFAMGSISSTGCEDGCLIAPISDIYKIEFEDEYITGINLLFENRDLRKLGDFESWQQIRSLAAEHAFSDYMSVLALLRANHRLVNLFAYDGASIYGFVTEFGSGYVELDVVSDNGLRDGSVGIDLETIRKIEFGTSCEIAIEKLCGLRPARMNRE
ncbi:MAG: hypothetical protein H0W86_07765 [Armatimonadetes bacterium]|nr:hypothetical protein [Armatimonadota bacterium]